MLKQTKGLSTLNRKHFREALLNKGTALIDAENEYISDDISLVRPSEKVVWDGEQFVTVPANEPAYHVDFETGEKVLLVEKEATNFFPYSDNFASLLSEDSNRLQYENGTTAVYYADSSTSTVSALPLDFIDTEPFVFTVDYKFNKNTNYQTGGIGLGRSVGNSDVRWAFSFNSDFTVSDLGVGTITEFTIIPLHGGWSRAVMLCSGVLNSSRQMKVRGSGNLKNPSNTKPFIWFKNVNVVQGKHLSTPIITTGSSVTRAADTITYIGEPLEGTELIQTDDEFYCEKDESSTLIDTAGGVGGIRKYAHIPKDLTGLALNRFKSKEVSSE